MSEWAFTIAINEKKCPRCHADEGQPCRTPKGHKTMTPHGARISLLTKNDWDRCKGTSLSIGETISLQNEGSPEEKKE